MIDEPVPALLIEVCVDSVESAVSAVKGGADRLEVCANLGIGGGTTPSPGLLRSIQRSVKDVPLMVMIRPRVGDFRYSNHEVGVMLEDIAFFKELGVRGFVVGALNEMGRVDVDIMKRLVDSILPLEVCFHRAFDMTRDPDEALEDIIEIGGISRLLTSGHGSSVTESLETLQRLFETAKRLQGDDIWGLTIMPGGGVNHKTVETIMKTLLPAGLREIHLSGGKWSDGHMRYRREGMGFGASVEHEWSVWKSHRREIQRVREIAGVAWDNYWDSISEPNDEGVESEEDVASHPED